MKLQKTHLLILLLLLTALLLMTACTTTDPSTETDPPAAESTTGGSESSSESESETTTEPADDELLEIAGKELAYRITVPQNASETLTNAAGALFSSVNMKSGVRLSMSDDWVAPNKKAPVYEILIGLTVREESMNASKAIRYDDFMIRVDGTKLVLIGATEEKTVEAVNYLIKHHLNKDGIHLPKDFVYHEKGEYTAEIPTLGGVSLSEYTLLYEKGSCKNYAQQMHRLLGEAYGVNLPIVFLDNAPESNYEIVFGTSARKKLTTPDFYEYTIEVEASRIFLIGYDSYAYANACVKLINEINAQNGKVSSPDSLAYHYDLPDRLEYLQDPSLLYMRWAAEFTTPDWMLDYKAKKKALFGGNGTSDLWINAHRADQGRYPENSLEAIISCYYLGVTVVEIDIQITRDGVMVLMHDSTLTRTTNASEYIGKEGYPDSANVSNWTYKQLQSLRLKEGLGGKDAPLTDFKIATLEEALIITKDRMFIVPDKSENWQYISTTDVMADSKENFLYDMMKKTGNYESILVSYGKPNGNFFSAAQALEIQAALKEASGVTPFILLRGTPNECVTNYTTLQSKVPGTFALQINGDYRTSYKYETATSKYEDVCTFAAWTISSGSDGFNDYEDIWKIMYNKGVRMIMTNDVLGMAQYAAKIHKD